MRKNEPTRNPSRYVSIGNAAERASVSKDTIRRMIASGELHAYSFGVRSASPPKTSTRPYARCDKRPLIRPAGQTLLHVYCTKTPENHKNLRIPGVLGVVVPAGFEPATFRV